MINEQRLLDSFLQLVQIDSITYEEQSVVRYLLGKLELIADSGVAVRVDDVGKKIGGDSGNLTVSISGDSSVPSIMFSAHLDTVEPGRNIRPEIKDRTITSGAESILGADDKAGVAALLEMAISVTERDIPHGPIEIIFSVAEEKGLLGAKNLDISRVKSKYAFIFDSASPVGYITVRAPFQDSISAIIQGKSTHAGVNPETGVNAIVAAAKAIGAMRLGRIDKETTANVGVIKGGRAANIVPDEVEIKAEARSLDETKLSSQTSSILDALRTKAEEQGATVDIDARREYDGFNLTADDWVVRIVQDAAAKIGLRTVLEATGGGADTNVYNTRGLAAVGLGVGYIHPHSTQESITIAELERAAKLAISIVETVEKKGSDLQS